MRFHHRVLSPLPLSLGVAKAGKNHLNYCSKITPSSHWDTTTLLYSIVTEICYNMAFAFSAFDFNCASRALNIYVKFCCTLY
jgi:hypothetical protein